MNERNCTTCSNAIFCEFWGEYKCKEKKERIYDTEDGATCEFYKRGTPESKCHCQDCETRDIKELEGNKVK